MKKNNMLACSIFLASASILLNSCSSNETIEQTTSLKISSFTNSGCKLNVETAKPLTNDPNEKVQYTATEDGGLKISHFNVYFNCAADIYTEVALDNDSKTIVINEKNKSKEQADCMCNFDISTEVKKLEDGKYTIIIKNEAERDFTFDINYNKDLKGEIEIQRPKYNLR